MPRPLTERIADTLAALERGGDAWVATSGDGPTLVPLALAWDGAHAILSTTAQSITARNVQHDPRVRIGFGATRDVVMIDGTADVIRIEDAGSFADSFAAHADWDPRAEDGDWVYLVVTLRRVQAWRESDEISGRTVMRDGRWLEA